ncbi:asparaginase [Paenibacillus xylaniclasticus]|uniref:asparaginase n=1 Tax=Paenibacillus xylaniclasticus TaxID=588083 RepID=UPI000FD77212|nr:MULTISPECIES: asparaginase [Paenibacillus]GFN33075.1 asparaginase [Paenibacillus curdlanolyticus]
MAALSSRLIDKAGGVPLAVARRGEEIENVHYGHIAVVHADGPLVVSAGDPNVAAYMRSTAKPVQSIPIIQAGVMERYSLPEAAIAIMAASHRGEQAQIDLLESMLRLTGVQEEDLIFHAGFPLDQEARKAYLRAGGSPRKLFHNCAGKHIGLLAACMLRGWPIQGYAEPEHPIQQEIKRLVAELTDVPMNDLIGGYDGCGLPVYAIPLWQLAGLYARLASPRANAIYAEEDCMAIERITKAMNDYPELVEGSGRLASLLLTDVNCVAKSGAQGVFAVGLRYEQLGIVMKLSDGMESAWPVILSEVLRQLAEYGRIASREADALCSRIEKAFPSELMNDANRVIGRREAVFQLTSSSI